MMGSDIGLYDGVRYRPICYMMGSDIGLYAGVR